MPYQKVTFLDDLPDIDTMENQPSTEKFLKKQHIVPPESGMYMYSHPPPPPPPTKKYDVMYNPRANMDSNYHPVHDDYEPISTSNCNCQDLYNHYSECPVCQKFYKSETTIYLVIIAILMITCALLAKKVLNV